MLTLWECSQWYDNILDIDTRTMTWNFLFQILPVTKVMYVINKKGHRCRTKKLISTVHVWSGYFVIWRKDFKQIFFSTKFFFRWKFPDQISSKQFVLCVSFRPFQDLFWNKFRREKIFREKRLQLFVFYAGILNPKFSNISKKTYDKTN